jgi:FkbM family methyltransferase
LRSQSVEPTPVREQAADLSPLLAQAIALHQQDQHLKALEVIAAALARNPRSADALANQALVLHRLGRDEEALASCDRALELRPTDPAILNLRGIVLRDLGQLAESLESYDRALAIDPDHADALNNRANVLWQLERFEEALARYDQALAIRPHYPEALNGRGNVLVALKRHEDGLASFNQALILRPNYADAHNGCGNALFELSRYEEALENYDRSLALRPDYPEALHNRGRVLGQLDRFEEALASFDRALALRPQYLEALHNRGNTLARLKRHQDALASYERALAIQPDYPDALSGAGVALVELGKYEEALASYDRALAIRPDYAVGFNNRGKALLELRRLDEALASYDHALRLDPDNADHRLNRALLLLLCGSFGEGWREYEWRRKRKAWTKQAFYGPEWAREKVPGARVLLYSEQGLGDMIQFVRFARVVARRGAKVILGVPTPLSGLLRRLDGDAVIVGSGEQLPEYDCHLPLMSVPFVLDWVPEQSAAEIPYLSAEPTRVARWSSRLPAGRFRVGIAWQGSPSPLADRGRSIPLKAFAPLCRIPGVKLISLQKAAGVEQLSNLPPGMAVETLGTEFDSGSDAFLDTAAVMMDLDLIVTCDTAVAHLAGALGRPVWIALRHVPDWRWMMDRADSPWYPTARLFRQARAGDWDEVLASISAELSRIVANAYPALDREDLDTPEKKPRSNTSSHRRKPVPMPPIDPGLRRDNNVAGTVEGSLSVPVSVGELIDKLTILTIKSERMGDPEQLANVRRELEILTEARSRLTRGVQKIEALERELKRVNEELWEIEDRIRDCERQADFGPVFTKLARAVYKTNDRRAVIKRRINEISGSPLIEEKSYSPPEASAVDECGLSQRLDQAISVHQKGELAQAEHLYSSILDEHPDHVDASHLLGVVRHQQGRHLEALELIGSALYRNPRSAHALANHGAVLERLGRHEEALTSYEKALALRPDDVRALYARANLLKALGRLEEALAGYGKLTALEPGHAPALNNSGNALAELGRLDQALANYDRALEARPDYAEALNNRGNALAELSRFEEALASYERALAVRPDYAEALNGRGNMLRQGKRFEEAIASYDRALAIRPDYPEALTNRGNALLELQRYEEALASYDRSLSLRPDDPDSLNGRGNALRQLNRFEDALSSHDRALAVRPDDTIALNHRGITLWELDRFEEAVASYDRALAVRPGYPHALNNRGKALRELGRLDEALASYDRALQLDPENADHRLNRALLLLLLGSFGDGWREYEWRRKTKEWGKRTVNGPEWAGEDLSGQRLLLCGEQGLGDTIQFARFARSVAMRGAKVILEVQAPLSGVLQRLDSEAVIVRAGEPLPDFDRHLPLMSAPFALGWTPDQGAGEIHYLSADPVRVDQWSRRLPAGAFRVGIAWQGRPAAPIDKGRSIPLKAFAPLGRIPGVKLISLQKGPGVEQMAELPPGMAVETLGPDFDSGPDAFLDTAAVMMHLDLIVTSDTAVAHLAGALGRPVWIALRHVPDWRWMMHCEDSPWYPTARLFRQNRLGAWDEVFERMASELAPAVAVNALPERDMPPSVTAAGSKADTPQDSNRRPATVMKECRHGKMVFLACDTYIGRSLDIYGEFSELEARVFTQFLRPADVVAEVGANIGAHTVHIAKLVGSAGLVLAFEPQRVIFQLLCANIGLNELFHVRTHQAALGAECSTIKVPALDYTADNNFGGLSLREVSAGEDVPLLSLDSLALRALRMLKVDAEGMETEVLAGARDTISRLRPILYLENDRRSQSEGLIKTIGDLGYNMWWHLPPLFNPSNFRQISQNIFGGIVSVNILCLPREELARISGLRPVTGPEDWWQRE